MGATICPMGAKDWRDALALWAIPQHILDQAPEPPWGFAPEVFVAGAREALTQPTTPTHRRMAEALPDGGALLDVGAGAGAASLPVAGGAARLAAVDESAAMLDRMAELAAEVAPQVALTRVEGRWPDVASQAGVADVVVCAHVAYNVADLAPFVLALTEAARVRVVLELTAVHPQAALTPLWRHFWDLERPTGPTAADALDVVRDVVGRAVADESWTRPGLWSGDIGWLRRRLCLGPDRDAEVAQLLEQHSDPAVEVVTAWWPGGALDH